MPLPYSFLLGMLVLFALGDLGLELPREADPTRLVPYLALVFLPGMIVWFTARRNRATWLGTRRRRRLGSRSRLLARLFLVPTTYGLILLPGELALVADQYNGGSIAASAAMMLAPLLAMEVCVNLSLRHATRHDEVLTESNGPPPFHLTLVAFMSIMAIGSATVFDLLSLSRACEVFFAGTALGQTLGVIAFIAVLCFLLPPVFRAMTPVSRQVPEGALMTARALGFPTAAVFVMRTGERLVNAALVGPLPRFRYLFLTDGLVTLLNPISLQGVVAHEVGHAKAGHPLLLLVTFVVFPLLLCHPLDVVGLSQLDVVPLLGLSAVALLAVLHLVRRMAHWFEYEADLISAEALGDSKPCILALQQVSDLSQASADRASFRHPSEDQRIERLLACDGDPWYRERFLRKGELLRRGLVVALCVVLLSSLWAHARLWPVDRLVQDFYTGRFPAAEARLAMLPEDLPPGRDELVKELREEIAVARSLYPDGGVWSEIKEDLAARALSRAWTELELAGPVAARPWFAVGMAKAQPTPRELSLYYYCEAVADAEDERAEALRSHILREFELDETVRKILRG